MQFDMPHVAFQIFLQHQVRVLTFSNCFTGTKTKADYETIETISTKAQSKGSFSNCNNRIGMPIILLR